MPHGQDYIRGLPEYDNHHLVTYLHDERTALEAFVAIHRKNGALPSFGATRLWQYRSEEEALRDALRLSRLMSYKAALASLPCGGAKGVIIHSGEPTEDHRSALIEAYADKISSLKDSFVTGTDVGIRQSDLRVMRERTPNIIGFNDNTAEFTALGVYHAICCALRHVHGDDDLKERTFAIQGVGKVGGELLKLLYGETRGIFVADIDDERLRMMRSAYPNIEIVPTETIHRQVVDVFSPCALSSAVKTSNVSELACRIVAGGANNQLEKEDVGDILHKMDILYAPDYVVNAGGLIAVYDEYEHSDYDAERVREKVVKIEGRLDALIKASREQNRPISRIANEMAERIFNNYGKQ